MFRNPMIHYLTTDEFSRTGRGMMVMEDYPGEKNKRMIWRVDFVYDLDLSPTEFLEMIEELTQALHIVIKFGSPNYAEGEDFDESRALKFTSASTM